MKPERPILRYFGGKWMLAPWILDHFPAHDCYVEPFGGGGSVLMRKEPARIEVYNDLDHQVVNVFRVLRNPVLSVQLASELKHTPFSREEFDQAYEPCSDVVESARRTIIRSLMGFGGDSITHKTGFRVNSNQSSRVPAKDWINYPDQIARFHERLHGVVIENKDAKEVMEQQDGPGTLHFVDPPYVTNTRVVTTGYRFEMDDDAHRQLCAFIKDLKGMVILCGYENPLYAALGWETRKRETYGDGACERTEVLWLNPAAVGAQAQGGLFDALAAGASDSKALNTLGNE